jgi:peptidyl-prolyl cis-trans isomerase C
MAAGAAGGLAMMLALGACTEDQPAPEEAVIEVSEVVATVDDSPIYASDVQLEAEAQGATDAGQPLEFDSAEFNRVLDQLIDVKLMALEAEQRGLDQEPTARHRLDAAREHILGNILVETVVGERVGEAEIRKMYEAQVAIWELGEEAHVRHIVAASRADIDKIVKDLNAGADFAVLASQKSIDQPTRLEGGDLGFMTEDEAPPEIARAIRSTATGGVSKPFETSMGWHVVKVEERRKEQPPTLEELRQPILKHLTMMQIGEVLKELRTQAKIEKTTSPQNSTIEVDPFDTAPEEKAPEPEAEAPDAAFEVIGPRAPVAESRTPAPPAAETIAPKADASRPAAQPPAAQQGGQPAAKPAAPAQTPPPAPVGETRGSSGQ